MQSDSVTDKAVEAVNRLLHVSGKALLRNGIMPETWYSLALSENEGEHQVLLSFPSGQVSR